MHWLLWTVIRQRVGNQSCLKLEEFGRSSLEKMNIGMSCRYCQLMMVILLDEYQNSPFRSDVLVPLGWGNQAASFLPANGASLWAISFVRSHSCEWCELYRVNSQVNSLNDSRYSKQNELNKTSDHLRSCEFTQVCRWRIKDVLCCSITIVHKLSICSLSFNIPTQS